MVDRYGSDILRAPRRTAAPPAPTVTAEPGLVLECASSGFCGAVVGMEKTSEGWAVRLEDRQGSRRMFPLSPGAFLLEGRPVTLERPVTAAPAPPTRSASGSVYVRDAAPQVARASRVWVEGIHDAELIERVWGHDLRVAGVVVEPMHGADHLPEAVAAFGPGPDRRLGVLLDHLVPGTKETRLARSVIAAHSPFVAVVGHPYVDVWQAVKPQTLGIPAWPVVPRGLPWKAEVARALGWPEDEGLAWRGILSRVRHFRDLEPAFLGRVEELIDFVAGSD